MITTSTRASRSHIRTSHWQLQGAFMFCILAGLTWFLAMQVEEALWQTLFLLYVVAVSGLLLINRLSCQLQDTNIRKLGYVFLAKVALSVLVLFVGWVPYLLNTSSSVFGYDPQRYYFMADDLARNNLHITSIPLNYAGIVYYYAVFFKILGTNPVIPALINVFVTLWASLVLIRVGYQIKPTRGKHDWTLGCCMIIPEVFWYDLLSSRETISMSLIVLSTLSGAQLIANWGNRFWNWVTSSLAFLLLSLIRTVMVVPLFGAILLLWIQSQLRTRLHSYQVLLISTLAVVFSFAPQWSQALGSAEFSLSYRMTIYRMAEEARATSPDPDRSFGNLFVPDNMVEMIVFAPIRMAINVVTPRFFRIEDLWRRSVGAENAWEGIATLLSTLLYITLFPLVIASLIEAARVNRNALVFQIPFWLVWAGISVGNPAIHLRYRVMGALLMWGCIWLGRTADQRLLGRLYYLWVMLLVLGGMSYVSYKLLV